MLCNGIFMGLNMSFSPFELRVLFLQSKEGAEKPSHLGIT